MSKFRRYGNKYCGCTRSTERHEAKGNGSFVCLRCGSVKLPVALLASATRGKVE